MVKPRLVLIMGLPCSGKTTYALSDCFVGFDYINPMKFNGDVDKLRANLFALIDLRRDIVIDDGNLTTKDRARYLQLFKDYKIFGRKYPPEYITECHYIVTTASDIFKNGEARQSAGGPRLNKPQLIHARGLIEVPTMAEGFQVVIRVPPDNSGGLQVNRAVFFSLPSVVFSSKGHITPIKPSDVKVYHDVNRLFVEYFKQGYLFIGVANLPMIETKQISIDMAQDCIIETIKQLCPPIEAVYYSPHLLSFSNDISLPNPAFAHRAKDRFKINLEASTMIGATRVDLQFAKNAGIGTFVHRDDFLKTKTISEIPVDGDWH